MEMSTRVYSAANEMDFALMTCGCSSSGRAPPCQGGGSEFEPRHPLQMKAHEGHALSFKLSHLLPSCAYTVVSGAIAKW